MIAASALTAALKAMGPAAILAGDPMTNSGMIHVGEFEGDRTFDVEFTENKLTLPERTGGVPHDATVNVNAASIKGSFVLNSRTTSVWPTISPHGVRGGGSKGFNAVVPTTVLLIPYSELGGSLDWDSAGAPAQWVRTAGNGAPAAAGAAAAPVNAVWLWKAYPVFTSVPYNFNEGGKVLVDVTFVAMLDMTKPDGHMVYTLGDPRTLAPTPILVDL